MSFPSRRSSDMGLGGGAQHVAVHQILVPGMPDPEPHAPEVLADMGFQGADAVMAAGAAALLHAQLAGRQVDLVVEHDERFRRQLMEAQRLADRAAGLVQDRKSTRLNSSH